VQRYHIEVAHVDHAARLESRDDAAYVEELSSQLSVEAFHYRLLESVPAGANCESWWREERYRFFKEVADERKLSLILTAHHRDDLVETVLSRFLMNRDIVGPEPFNARQRVIRPLLGVSKQTIRETLSEWGVPWREDSSNESLCRTRNRVRHRLIPILSDEFGVGEDVLSEQAERLSEDSRFLWELAEQYLSPLAELTSGSRGWMQQMRTVVTAAPPPLRWRIVSRALLPLIGYPLGPRHAARFIRFLSGSRREFQCAGGISVVRSGGGLKRA
jgi:tRNA(Ile)-lysidine synthase